MARTSHGVTQASVESHTEVKPLPGIVVGTGSIRHRCKMWNEEDDNASGDLFHSNSWRSYSSVKRCTLKIS